MKTYKASKPYPDQRPGSRLCDDMDDRAKRNHENSHKRGTPFKSSTDADAWEVLPEAWETGKESTNSCANCGRTGHHSEFTEALRRCGTGYGEWYCNDGTGCQMVRCAHCGIETSKSLVIWVKVEGQDQRVPKCRNGWGCRRNDAR